MGGVRVERELNKRMKANDDDIHMNVGTCIDMAVGACDICRPLLHR